LLHLREKDVLTEDNLYVNRLLQIWMKKNRPIEQAREELIKVNPIANHNIGLGLEYKNSKKHEKAIESFKAALEVDSDNLQAQVNLAQVYLDQKNVEKAIVEFEKALLIDDEDIATRTGLCDAYLAQGDQTLAKGRPRDAVLYYQKILAMNSEHDEARQRMAEINRQRAEKALVDNKEEEALSAFTMSLTFTPEDLSLIKRVEEVTAEKKAKVLAEQIARSEKEAVARNWEKAIAALNEALEAFPNDESILKKITLMKERRDVDLAKADQTEKYSRRDTPFVTNNENPKISMPAKKAASTNVFLQTKDGQAFPLERDICTIGRQGEQKKVTSDIDVTAFDSGKLASRRHAIVQSRNGTFYISDVDSTNGTYVNGEKIKPQEPRELKAGDVIELGKSGVRFTFLM
jgi:tetratricopeptide (TPR) repeat protein